MTPEELMQRAHEAAKNAYAPYSRFRVGAALKMTSGKVICGINVENRSYGLTNCAERTAIFTALSMGERNIQAIAVAGPNSHEPLPPCGACRQVISEFCDSETPLYYDDGNGSYISSTVGELYPANSLMNLAGEGRKHQSQL